MGASLRLPARVHLPSGRVVRLAERAARAAAGRIGPEPSPCLRDLAILAADGVLADEEGAPLDPRDLPLRDYHVLRALLAHAAVAPEREEEFTCQNCDAPFRVAPSRLLEISPFIDGELDDPELDAPFDHSRAHPIPPLRVGRELARSVRIAERTVRDSLPLFRAAGTAALRLTPALVVAMGVTALGRERRTTRLSDALARAPDGAWQAIVDWLHDAHYPARLVAIHRCSGCGARNDLDVPLERELAREPRASISRPSDRGLLPDLDAFEARVRAAAEPIYRDRGVRNVDLVVDAGVPLCDEGGEPLLGCYTPGGVDPDLGVACPPEIRLFYRTFQIEFSEDPSFNLDGEIGETIDHELTHHLNHGAGSDPLDDEECAEIEQETARRVGRAEVGRRARLTFVSDLIGFLRATWPAWVLVAIGSVLAWCGSAEGGF